MFHNLLEEGNSNNNNHNKNLRNKTGNYLQVTLITIVQFLIARCTHVDPFCPRFTCPWAPRGVYLPNIIFDNRLEIATGVLL